MAHWTQSATLADPPELTDEEKLLEVALAEFKTADLAFTEACWRLAKYRNEHADRRPVLVGARFDVRVGAGSPALAQLEVEASHALDERNKALSRWSQLKMANEERKAHGG